MDNFSFVLKMDIKQEAITVEMAFRKGGDDGEIVRNELIEQGILLRAKQAIEMMIKRDRINKITYIKESRLNRDEKLIKEEFHKNLA